MKVVYDPETDTLDLLFRDKPACESDEIREGIIIDYARDGKVVSIEVLDASEHVKEPGVMMYQTGLSSSSKAKPSARNGRQ